MLEHIDLLNELEREFCELYPNSSKPRVFFAPGRVNLIGEHTDYLGGFVMPLALDLGITMLVSPSEDGLFHLTSQNFPNTVVIGDNLAFTKDDSWGNYPKGVIVELLNLGYKPEGLNVLYSSNLPTGAGLSSSAAIGMVTAFALNTLNKFDLSNEELAFLCQRMENNYIGVKSGIMDQFAVGLSKKDHAIFLDCLNIKYELVPLILNGHSIVITDSKKKRGLQESRYNERRLEAEKALELIRELKPGVESYRDLTLSDLTLVNSSLYYPHKERARHIITENNRVLEAKEALQNNDLNRLGQLMLASHRSLSLDYEVTGKELDSLFMAQLDAGVFKTRMTGAGFGGCTVSLVEDQKIDSFVNIVRETYSEATGLIPEFYIAKSSDGVRELQFA